MTTMPACTCALCSFAGPASETLDLSKRPADRQVDAACVAGAVARLKGLCLTGAVVRGDLELDHRVIEGRLDLACTFDAFRAQDATFRYIVDLTGSVVKGDLDFRGAVLDRALVLDGVEVGGSVVLWDTKATGGIKAEQLIVVGSFTARGMIVPASANFNGSVFTKEATFELANVARSLSLRGAHCHEHVSFAGCKAGDIDLSLRTFAPPKVQPGAAPPVPRTPQTTFLDKTVTFDEADLRDFIAKETQFTGKVTFEDVKVDGKLSIVGGSCAELAITGFRGGEIALQGLTCASDLKLYGLNVTGLAEFDRCTVAGRIELTNARFGNDLLFASTKSALIDLSGTTVSGRLKIDGEGAAVGPAAGADFVFKLENVTVDQDVHVAAAIVGNVALRGLNVKGGFDLRGTMIEGTLRATFLTVARDLTLFAKPDELLANGRDVPASIRSALDLTGAKIAGSLCLPTAPLPSKIRLTGATLGSLAFITPEGTPPPPTPNPRQWKPTDPAVPEIHMRGCSYGAIEGDVLWFMDRFPLREKIANTKRRGRSPERQPFLMLERVLRTAGRDEDANAIYYEGRRRTAPQSAWWQYWPQFIFSGFGVRPGRLGLLFLTVLAVGAIFFTIAAGSVHHMSTAFRPHTVAASAPAKASQPTGKPAVTYMSADEWTHTCGTETANAGEALWLALITLIPSPGLGGDVIVADGCPVRIAGVELWPWVTDGVVFLLKFGGLTLIPLAIAIISGLLRPPARA